MTKRNSLGNRRSMLGAFLVFVLLSLCCVAQAGAAEKKMSDLEREIQAQEKNHQKIVRQIKENEKKLKDASQKENKIIKDISSLSNKMAEAESRLHVTQLKLNQTANKLSDTQQKIKTTEARIEEAKRLLSNRMVAVYKYGGVAEFNLFLSATGAQDAMSTTYLLSKIAEQDRALIAELTHQKAILDRARTELVKQRTELDSRNKDLEKQKTSIQRTSKDRNDLLQKVRKDKALFMAEQEELRKASNELKGKVNQLLAAKKKMQSANNTSTPVYYTGGKLAWPLKGKLTSQYGSRVHPVFKTRAMHSGLDIDGKKGDPVRAASDGEVLFTGWLRGYGQVVILDHGGNLTTVYAHLSGIDTKENAKVKMGDKIGRVGSTGVATGDHLHFEVRVNGNTTDPLKYLR